MLADLLACAAMPVPDLSRHYDVLAVREKAGVKIFGFHHLRVYFISQCGMAGIDPLTTARWVGHRDLTLISRVYGQVADEHRQRMAAKLNFGGKEMP